MEQQARLHGMGGQLRYVTGSYLGITSPTSKCPGSPNTTFQVRNDNRQQLFRYAACQLALARPKCVTKTWCEQVFQEVAQVGLCGQLYVDTHITPSSTLEGSKGTPADLRAYQSGVGLLSHSTRWVDPMLQGRKSLLHRCKIWPGQ